MHKCASRSRRGALDFGTVDSESPQCRKNESCSCLRRKRGERESAPATALQSCHKPSLPSWGTESTCSLSTVCLAQHTGDPLFVWLTTQDFVAADLVGQRDHSLVRTQRKLLTGEEAEEEDRSNQHWEHMVTHPHNLTQLTLPWVSLGS